MVKKEYMYSEVDVYLDEGCGRCALYQTPRCKVKTWQRELTELRRIALECGLEEEFKWSQPCYTYQKKNILIVTAFKNYAALAFFKGTLIKDVSNILIAAGPNSQSARQVRFTNQKDILSMEAVLKAYIFEAIEVEKSGLKVEFKKEMQLPAELEDKFDELPELKAAFMGLTPGRQRGYILHFSQPKQAKTRVARIEKCIEKILSGKGFNDR